MANLVAGFQWWRRLVGGRWARVTGMFWGRNWVRVGPECVERVEENWTRGDWHRPFDWWTEDVWTPLYCRFAWFHLMRHREDGHFIVVYQRGGEPTINGYYIVVACWTPAGCRDAAKTELEFHKFTEYVGRKNLQQIIKQVGLEKRGPVPPFDHHTTEPA